MYGLMQKWMSSGFAKKLIKGTFWMTLGTLVSRGLLALASIFLVRILSVEDYGEFGMVKSTIDNFLIFATMGVGLTTTKYVAEYKAGNQYEAGELLGAALALVSVLSVLVAILITIFSGFISTEILNNEGIQIPLIIGAFTLVFIALNGTQMGALLGYEAYSKNSFANIIQGIALFFGMVIGALVAGVKGAVMGNLIAIFLVAVVLQRFLIKESNKHRIAISLRNWKKSFRKIYLFAVPASLSTIIVAPTIWILNSILVNSEQGYQQLGLYSAVIIFSTAIQMFNGSISNVLLPIFISKSEEKSPKREFFNYYGSWIISIVISLPLFLFPEIVGLILGDKYDLNSIVPILLMSIFSTLVITNRSGVTRDLIIQNKMWLSVLSMGQWAVTNLVVFYFLRSYGALGFAFSYMISYLLNYFFSLPLFIRLRIVPAIIFYNFWNFMVWTLLLLLVVVGTLLYQYMWLKMFLNVLIIILLSGSLFKLYKRWLVIS